jgi:serine-type D-Ala-D-Ala carboxypeptidase/endopeptidase (penicillin-binding protein 4)
MRALLFLSCCLYFFGCSPAKRLGLKKAFEKTESTFQEHTGFMLYDLEKKTAVYSFNSEKYFTPASNTKIFTFYASLRILGDSVPALKYVERNDSLIFWGTGDPSFLYRYTFNNGKLYNFLAGAKNDLYFSSSNFYATHFGPGWAWDDYNDYYSPERSPFPVYGNILTLKRLGTNFTITPRYFQKQFSVGKRMERERVVRDLHGNSVKYHPGTGRTKNPPEWDVPFHVSDDLVAELLSDTLKRIVKISRSRQPPLAVPLYSIPTDSLYKVMMQESDNFIAEQLLLMCADVVRDSLETKVAIDYAMENFLTDLPDKPIWVDGSGLSRYNLFTPRSIVKLWEKIFSLVPRERLFALLATGGGNGTLKNWFKADQQYIFGKTGSLSNNHSLSGFLVTRKGKLLIFSFMNNNFAAPMSQVRKNMQEILYNIYQNY